MIFVTVGTHEQQFNRLIEEIDRLKGNGTIKDEVIMQTGYCTYKPKYCKWSELLPYDQMLENVEKAEIPIVVPRQKRYDEHVNNHQVEFSSAVKERYGNIIVVKNIKNLEKAILHYDRIVGTMNAEIDNNNLKFNQKLEEIVNGIFK